MKMQHPGQKYRKWRVIRLKRAQMKAAELVPFWECNAEELLAQVRAERKAQEVRAGIILGLDISLN